jgi:hypothetical protein
MEQRRREEEARIQHDSSNMPQPALGDEQQEAPEAPKTT